MAYNKTDRADAPMKRRNIRRRKKGTCAKHQRAITIAVKRARQIAVLPYVQD